VSSVRINTSADVYTLVGTSCENLKCFRGRLVGPSAQSLEFLNSTIYLPFKKYHAMVDLVKQVLCN